MKLTPAQYWRSLTSDEKLSLSSRLMVDKGYLSNVMNGNFQPGKPLCLKIEAETDGYITKKVLRPNTNWKKYGH